MLQGAAVPATAAVAQTNSEQRDSFPSAAVGELPAVGAVEAVAKPAGMTQECWE